MIIIIGEQRKSRRILLFASKATNDFAHLQKMASKGVISEVKHSLSINVYILLTSLYTNLLLLVERICLNIKMFYLWFNFLY